MRCAPIGSSITVSTADNSAAVTPARAAFSAYSAGGGPGLGPPCEMPSTTTSTPAGAVTNLNTVAVRSSASESTTVAAPAAAVNGCVTDRKPMRDTLSV